MFGLSMTEFILIVVLALVVIGPKRLPDIAKSIGKAYGEFKRTMNDLKQSVNVDINDTSKPSAAQRHQELKEDLAETYKSQWEQKLPAASAKVPSSDNSSNAVTTSAGSEEKSV